MDDNALNPPVNDIWSQPQTTPPPSSSSSSSSTIIPQGEKLGYRTESAPELSSVSEQDLGTEIPINSPEVLGTPESLKPPQPSIKNEEPQHIAQPEPVLAPAVEMSGKGNLIDKRTGKERLHRVDSLADDQTRKADLEEQDFIENVERTHSLV